MKRFLENARIAWRFSSQGWIIFCFVGVAFNLTVAVFSALHGHPIAAVIDGVMGGTMIGMVFMNVLMSVARYRMNEERKKEREGVTYFPVPTELADQLFRAADSGDIASMTIHIGTEPPDAKKKHLH